MSRAKLGKGQIEIVDKMLKNENKKAYDEEFWTKLSEVLNLKGPVVKSTEDWKRVFALINNNKIHCFNKFIYSGAISLD